MKKWLYLLIGLALVAGKCKKDNEEDNGSEEQTYECLPKEIDYIDHDDALENDNTVYFYKGNAIDYKVYNYTRSDSTPGSYNLKYYYTDKSKGLLDRIDIVIQGSVVAKIVYTTQNDRITHRKLQVISNDGSQWFDAWDVDYTYDGNGKMVEARIQDYDLWNDGANPTDETAVYTYTGDNATDVKYYDTSDLQTVKEEYEFEYDQGKRSFDNVVTQTYPQTRVNNVTRTIHHVYVPAPGSTYETTTTIQYNGKGFPTQFATMDDRNNPVSTTSVTYDNCE